MHPFVEYLQDLRDIHSTGAAVKETSYYPALANLINEIGKTLTPKVRCIIALANQGKGMPDGGIFTKEQFSKTTDSEPRSGQKPARGAIEVKSWLDDLDKIKETKQVGDYLSEYHLLLLTNYRDFLMLRQDPAGPITALERCTLAKDEVAFRELLAHPQKAEKEHGERLTEYLKRVMLTNAPLAAPQDVAYFLASYAREARFRVEAAPLPAMEEMRSALQAALGMKFEGDKGEHFFRSTLVQTLFYGVFSAWVLWHRKNPANQEAFDWRAAAHYLHVPFISALFEEFAKPSTVRALGLEEVLDWTAAALNRVQRPEFFNYFKDEHAVQYFYEPFLNAFDPELRKDLGVWYTPHEIVQYQVARVDTVLKEELGLPDGLADPSVVVLDPCCGTGAYLVEVIERINKTLKAKGADALSASDLKKAAMKRIFGFEILPAPFVVAHLQLGLLLNRLGAPLAADRAERVGVYLTNALTGWNELNVAETAEMEFMKELQIERDAARKVKREERILVVLGNPPYNAFAGTSPEEERGLVEPYKEGLNVPVDKGGWGIKKFNLDDLYVRFFRLAERRIAEMTGRGVVSFISNHSWISEPSFVVLRKHLLQNFDAFWIEGLHGNRKISEYAPDGKTSETIFAIKGFSTGIQQGVATSLWVKTGKGSEAPVVRFRDDCNAAKAEERRKQLIGSLAAKDFNAAYTQANPSPENRYSFRPEEVSSAYNSWPRLIDLAKISPLQGMDEDRANALIEIRKEELAHRMNKYLDPSADWGTVVPIGKGLVRNSAGFEAEKVRRATLARIKFDQKYIRRYLFRPSDYRYCYYTDASNVWKRHRPELWREFREENQCIISRPAATASPEGFPIYYSKALLARDCMRGHAIAFPFSLSEEKNISQHSANLSSQTLKYLEKIGVDLNPANQSFYETVWLHALAIGYSPAYLTENADGIRRDWPRIPLPKTRKVLENGAELGRKVASLLDTEAEMPGVTTGDTGPLLKTIGVFTRLGEGVLDQEKDLALTAGWGHAGKGGVTMPGKGRNIQRPYDADEMKALEDTAIARGIGMQELLSLLGSTTCDIYLNDTAYWKNIPLNVWEFYIGGYQVIKKWLSYRELPLLGRPLTSDEARYITGISRRLAELRLMSIKLDKHYHDSK